MDINEVISILDQAWSDQGFLGRLREGLFTVEDGDRFLSFLRSIDITEDSLLPKRFMSLMWYLPLFLRWQLERVQKHSGHSVAFDDFITKVDNTLEQVLGVP